jgi:histidinol-phosphate phosphatase family protein
MPDLALGRTSVGSSDLRQEAIDAILLANNAGIPIFLTTNQPGVAKGFISISDVLRVEAELETMLARSGAFLDDYRFCPHHPDRGFEGEVEELKLDCECRKPNPKMLNELAYHHCLDLGASVVIGDSIIDLQFAEKAGLAFIEANFDKPSSFASAVRQAIDMIVHAN